MFILGTKVHNITLSQAVMYAEGFLNSTRQHYIVTPNPEIVVRARRNRAYRRILNSADLSIADGVGLVWASRLLFNKSKAIKTRITGVDFMHEFLRVANDYGCTVLLLGGEDSAAKKSASRLKQRFPTINFYAIENIHSPHLDFLIREVFRPDCIFIALGAPRQEQWIHANLSRYPTIKVAMGVGGAFDFISGQLPRAPEVMRGLGFEWLWRVALEPWRAKRVFNAAIVFPFLVIHSCVIRKRGIIK